ncbi:DEAD/DEAH box helicase [Brevibacillus ginsengisoli]|uniref:DEAD/DEAH box helicase n=1 Tax=Brevibacillus ginsengisoli TaxID=363854 RepID=UPI003CE7DBC6
MSSELQLAAQLLEDGFFLIAGTQIDGSPVHPRELAGILFAWDEPSYYGTFISKTEQAIQLQPRQALDLFTSPSWLEHMTYSPEESFLEFQQVAQMVNKALLEGSFVPSLYDWKKGFIGWRILPTEDQLIPEYAHSWLTHILNDMLDEETKLDHAWREVNRQFPTLLLMGKQISAQVDEQEWLQSIGLLPDQTPFRTCLQVVESVSNDQEWRLQVLLQDRGQPELTYEMSTHSLTIDDELPLDWQNHWNRYLRDVQKFAEVIPWLVDDSEGLPIRTRLTNEEAWRFLTETSLQLIQAGIHVLLPAWWEQVRRTKPRLKAKVKSSTTAAQQSFFGISQVMDFEWKLAIGNIELSEEEFDQLLQQKQRLVRVKGEWIQLTPALLKQLQQTLKKNRENQQLTFREVMRLHLLQPREDEVWEDDPDDFSVPVEVELNQPLQKLFSQLQETKRLPMVEQPASFLGTLRQYQLEGSSWLLFLRRFGLGACLADDMGLGKTIQFITYLLQLKDASESMGPSLLICPTSVIGNWQKELERFAPSLKVHVHYGNKRLKDEEFISTVQKHDVVITTYALSHLDLHELSSISWDTICLDEAQHIKNSYTKQASAIRGLTGYHRIAMTGTPIENRLTELWSIFEFLNAGYLGSLHEFSQRYVFPIERDHRQDLVTQVQRFIQPFLLRRVKTDPVIQLDLPEKNEAKEYVPLTVEQGALYESTIRDMFNRLDDTTPMERRGLILTTLTRLKQICDHPDLILGQSLPLVDVSRSHKITRLLELVEDIRSKKERCLVFTQYVKMGELLQRILVQEGFGPVNFLYGGTPKEKRDQMISQFQNASLPDTERPGVLILSLRAGGTGLNLTEANHVFHLDRWWNPAVENQATDRAYRIGQERAVQVYKFITLGTIEERIDEMMERKLTLSEQIVGSSDNWITEMSTQELQELFMLRHEWMDSKG